LHTNIFIRQQTIRTTVERNLTRKNIINQPVTFKVNSQHKHIKLQSALQAYTVCNSMPTKSHSRRWCRCGSTESIKMQQQTKHSVQDVDLVKLPIFFYHCNNKKTTVYNTWLQWTYSIIQRNARPTSQSWHDWNAQAYRLLSLYNWQHQQASHLMFV